MIQIKMASITIALAAAALAGILPASAEPITVPNPSIERHPSLGILPDGYDQYHQWLAEAWRQFNRTDNGGPCRIWNPGRPGCGRQGTGSIDEGFNGTAPDGDCVIVVRSSRSDGANSLIDGVNEYYFEALAQVLTNNTPAIFDATKTYTLTAKVGRPPGSFSYTANWYGYAVQLAVGGTLVGGASFAGSCNGGTVIAQDVNTLTVPINGWVTSTVRYRPNPADVGLNGQPLQIRLCSLDDNANLANSGIVAFDDVKLEGDVVPAGDVTAPTLASSEIEDDKSGEPVSANRLVTFTVIFSESMDASTVLAAGFSNAGTATIIPGTITHVGGAIFTVQVTPITAGSLQLQVPAGAVMKDLAGNALDTSSAILDNTTITVDPEVASNGYWALLGNDIWSKSNNWFGGTVASGTDMTASFVNNITAHGTVFLNTPRTIGNITFSDATTASHDVMLSGNNPLNLDVTTGSPLVTVTNRTLTLSVPVTGTKGLSKTGPGLLSARVTEGLSGDGTVLQGTLEIGLGNGTCPANFSVAAGATLSYNLDDRKWLSKLTLDGVISGAGALFKGARTGLVLNNDNLYTGATSVNGGTLLLNSANALPGGIGTAGGTSALIFNGGIVGLGVGDFTRSLQAASVVSGVNFLGNGGWAAYGAHRVVNLGGAAAQVVWATADTGFNGKTLLFGGIGTNTAFTLSQASLPSTHTVTLVNPLDLGTAQRTVQVDKSLAAVEANLSGVLSGSGSLAKTGLGTLALSGNNTYTGTNTVSAGTLEVVNAASLGTNILYIAAAAKVQLDYSGTRVIGGLRINNVLQAKGVYGSSASGAPLANQDDVHFAGPGTVTVGPLFVITTVGYDALNDQLNLTWNSFPGATYTIENTQNLVDWDNLTTSIASGGPTTTRVVDAPQPGTFYRIKQQ